ncbi:hypothetical protein PCE1_004827 [Barthelona sp. PCE]
MLTDHESILVVFAHPDDESFFWSPTIFNLIDRGICVDFLCCTSGEYTQEGPSDELATTRAEELKNTANSFGVRNVDIIYDQSVCPDHPQKVWNRMRVCETIQDTFLRNKNTAILTFDEFGISGHTNHIACYNSCKFLTEETKVPLFFVKSVGKLPKFCFFAYIPYLFSRRFEKFRCSHRRAWSAFSNHRSQLLWYRYLFFAFSSYSWHNLVFQYLPEDGGD